MTAREALLEVLRTEGVRHLFGNPGSTELPLIDALASADDLRYVLALQEASAVGIAEGYAMASGRPAFVNLHTSAGVGNAIGALTNAQANLTPLVVTAGQQDYRHIATDPLLAGDLTGLARSVSKWVHEVRTPGELGTILRRAFHDAASSPTGPVFVSLPMDLVEDRADVAVPPASTILHRSVAEGLGELARLLAEPAVGKVAIVVGDEVSTSDAVTEVVELAEALGAPVHGAPLHSRGVFPPLHPLWAGMLAPAAAATRSTLSVYERVFLVAGRGFMAYPYTPGSALPDTTELLHLSPDPSQLGRVYTTRWAATGDPKATITALLPLVGGRVDSAAVAVAVAAAGATRHAAVQQLEDTALSRYDAAPMDPMAAAHALVRAMPTGSLIVDEAITTGVYVRGFHHEPVPGRYFFNRGGGLGWGMPAAVGVSLARGGEPVLCAVGDGSAMYSPQALWTAAREELPVVFAVVNNRQYLILKNNLRGMGGDSVRHDRFVAMDLVDPPIDYLSLATSMGVAATLVEKAHDVGDAVQAALDSHRPHLLELPIAAP